MQVFTENFIRTHKIELFALISHKKQQKTCTVKLKCLPLHSLKKKHNGAIAQLVEQRTENPCVPGSIPGGTTALSNTSRFANLGAIAQLVEQRTENPCVPGSTPGGTT